MTNERAGRAATSDGDLSWYLQHRPGRGTNGEAGMSENKFENVLLTGLSSLSPSLTLTP